MRLVAAAVLFIFDFQYHEPIKAKLLICWKTRKQTNQPNNLSDTNFRLVVVHNINAHITNKNFVAIQYGFSHVLPTTPKAESIYTTTQRQ